MDASKYKTERESNGCEASEISKSEQRRLQSLREKKEAYRSKEQAVQNALRDLDSKPRKNKIVFDEDIDAVVPCKVKKKERKELFEEDENEGEDDSTLEGIDFEIKDNILKKSAGVHLTLGNDERFKLDKRFADDGEADDQNNDAENVDPPDLQREKEWQLDILGSVLGTPIAPKTMDARPAKKGMIRYDPTANDHKEYELTIKKTEADTKKVKKKKKHEETEVTEDNPAEVSKDIYFSVSDSLTKSLKEGGQLSLLKMYGKEEDSEKNNIDTNAYKAEPITNKKFQFNFDGKNPFKYESSDDECKEEKAVTEKSAMNNNFQDEHENNLSQNTNWFFHNENDPRFNEATKFFSAQPEPNGDFKNLRRELKQIVRAKIKQNVNKNKPWSKKHKVRKVS